MPELLKEIDSLTTPQIIFKIHEAMKEMKKATEHDYWTSSKGHEELRKMNEDQTRKGVNIFDYAPSTKASLCPMIAPEDKWYEVELTADTGACDTAVPQLMSPGIPITPSLQSLR